jgi:hypothetical protein
MAISRTARQITVECDSCSNTFPGEIDEEFGEVLAAAKRDGWHVAKIAGEWLHGCRKCGRPT